MALDFGHAASVLIAFESSYGEQPNTGWRLLPVTAFEPGTRQPKDMLDVIGLPGGRDGGKVVRGPLTIEPRVEVPIDLEGIGYWLRALLGAPNTTPAGSDYTHVWLSGAASLPSISFERALVNSGEYLRIMGARGGTLDLSWNPGEVAQTATFGFVAKARTREGTTVEPTPDTAAFTPLVGGTCKVRRNGADLGGALSASLSFSNGLEQLREGNSGGYGISRAVGGATSLTGTIEIRSEDDTLTDDAEGEEPVSLTWEWAMAANKLLRVEVPRPHLTVLDKPIRGRGGVQATYEWVAEYDATVGARARFTLVNQVASY